ncbi:methyltransferase domain-containing protein [Nitrospira sp. M1]
MTNISDYDHMRGDRIEVSGACRFCDTPLTHTFVDLGMSPPCESYLHATQLNHMEPFYPLHVYVCATCLLVQLEEYVKPEHIFTEYAYFSSYSDSWLAHAKAYTDMASERFTLDDKSLVVELASNDGYLLQYFVEKNIPVLGIEPAVNIAKVANEKGIRTVVQFFCEETAREMAEKGQQADLVIGNNVLAQVPDLNGFIKGMKIILKPQGVISMEFPHLMRLMEEAQFDTIYHEHFSYFSFLTVERIFQAHGLKLFDVEELWTHGGSLRIFACHDTDTSKSTTQRIADLRATETDAGFGELEGHLAFEPKVRAIKWKILDFLIVTKREGKSVVGYGAPGKGNTLLNYCGIRSDFLDFTVDRNPYKQGKFLPGTHIPIEHPDKIRATKPDYLFVLPWNFKDEIIEQMAYIREWGGQFLVPIPDVKIY